MTASATTSRLPAVFISHGAPTLAIEDGAGHRFLQEYGRQLGRPRAIVVLSAHFSAGVAMVTAGENPETIHDFGGLPDELYRMKYPAPGDPALAGKIVELLVEGDVSARLTETRGFDHGAWIPLSLMYPAADVPVVQVSLDPRQGPEYHYRLGQLLAPLRDDGVLIIGSGGVTHNLAELQWSGSNGKAPDWAESFNEWVASAIAETEINDLLAYRKSGPHAVRNHPTEEHFFPLLFVLGAAYNEDRGVRVHHSYTYGALSMDSYEFGGDKRIYRDAAVLTRERNPRSQ